MKRRMVSSRCCCPFTANLPYCSTDNLTEWTDDFSVEKWTKSRGGATYWTVTGGTLSLPQSGATSAAWADELLKFDLKKHKTFNLSVDVTVPDVLNLALNDGAQCRLRLENFANNNAIGSFTIKASHPDSEWHYQFSGDPSVSVDSNKTSFTADTVSITGTLLNFFEGAGAFDDYATFSLAYKLNGNTIQTVRREINYAQTFNGFINFCFLYPRIDASWTAGAYQFVFDNFQYVAS